jgi:hypothetical protein
MLRLFSFKLDFICRIYGIKIFSGFNLIKSVIILQISNSDSFSVPAEISLHNTQILTHYESLTKHISQAKIIFARSSDREEMSGKFDTYPSLYDPKDKQKSFENWLEAAKKVRESGSRGILGQFMFGDLDDFMYRQYYDDKGQIITDTIKVFGSSNTSFYGKSQSLLLGTNPSFVMCGGLGSKIARGSKEVCLVQSNDYYDKNSRAYLSMI